MKIDGNKALAELCRRKFYRFVQEFWEVIIPETPVWNWHIEYLCDELQYLNTFVVKRLPKPYDLVINIPPGTTKSTIITQMYNAWVWTIDPSQRFITSSYAHALSLSHSVKTRDIITSDKYKRLFPEVELKFDQAGKSDFHNTLGGQRFTTSTGGTVTGMHAHQILIDDPLNPQQAVSEAERLTANEFVNVTLSSRKVDKAITPTILIMQRLHEEDPSGVMLSRSKKTRIKHICLPAELSDRVSPIELQGKYVNGLLDPVRLNKEVLEENRETLGSYGYAGQFSQNPVPQEGGIFNKSWFEIVEWDPRFEHLTWNMAADTAYTEKEINDPSGYIAYAVANNTLYIRDAQTEHLEFPELCKALPTFCRRNGYTHNSRIDIEPKASGLSLIQTLRKETMLNVRPGKVPTKDKVARAKEASPFVEAGRVKLIRGAWNKTFVDQVCTFPFAAHDELVDCLTMVVNGDIVHRKRKNTVTVRG